MKTVIVAGKELTEKQTDQLAKQVTFRHNVQTIEELQEFMNNLDCYVTEIENSNELKFTPRKVGFGSFLVDLT